MVQATMENGICPTCNNMTTCYHFSRRGPVFFCEQFDDGMLALSNPSPRPQRRRRPPPASAGNPGPEIGRLKGLCVNCDHRFTCPYSQPPEGVWHCEEYA